VLFSKVAVMLSRVAYGNVQSRRVQLSEVMVKSCDVT